MTPMQQCLMAQVNISLTRAAHFKMRIETGVYKNRVGKVRQGGLDGPFLTEEQILQDELSTHNSHIQLAQETLENFKRTLTEEDRRVLRP
jgi:hypothetical protein